MITINFDEEFREELFGEIEGIKKIWYENNLSATVSYDQTSASASCTAVETGYMQTFGMQLEYGDYFSVTDDVMGQQKIILGSDIASTLFPNGDALGKYVLVVTNKVRFSFEVTGVLKEQNSGMENTTSSCYIPRGFYEKKISPNPKASTVMVQAISKSRTTKLLEEKLRLLQKALHLLIFELSEFVQSLPALTLHLQNLQCRQEIGIRKALGAKPSIIRRQFLIESASISLLGGIIGIIFGIIVSFVIEYVRSQSFIISLESCIVAFVFSVFVGIFFGLSPASKAAKLDPVVALSGE